MSWYFKRHEASELAAVILGAVPAGVLMNSEIYQHHQQYLSAGKNPNGYCPDHGTGVSCTIGVVKASD
jgi:hypothetical protein